MNFETLREYILVCDCESITRAAERLYISQPSLSRTISNLEKEVGTTLFDREASCIHVNDKGREFYSFAQDTLQRFAELQNRIITEKDLGCGMSIYYSDDFFMDNVMPRYVNEISKDVKIHKDTERNGKTALLSSKCDVLFSSTPIDHKDLRSLLIFIDYVFVSVPNNHRLAGKTGAFLKDLDYEDILYLDDDKEDLQQFKKILKDRAPHHIVSSIGRRDIYEAMKGISDTLYFLSTSEKFFRRAEEPDDRVLIRILDKDLHFPHYLIYRNNADDKVKEFVNWLKDTMLVF